MSDVLLSVKTFSQLITENIRSFSLNPSAALPQGNSDAIQGGNGRPIGGSAALPGLLAQLCTTGQHPGSPGVLSTRRMQPRAAPGVESWTPPAAMLPLRLRLKGPILQGRLLTHAMHAQSMGLFTCSKLNTLLSAFA